MFIRLPVFQSRRTKFPSPRLFLAPLFLFLFTVSLFPPLQLLFPGRASFEASLSQRGGKRDRRGKSGRSMINRGR